MRAKTKLQTVISILAATLFLAAAVVPADAGTTRALSGTNVTKTRLNGLTAEASIVDADVESGGFLAVSQDQITNTVTLDYGYSFPDPTNPDYLIILQGHDQIPNSAFTVTRTSAHLAITTSSSFASVRCIINVNTGDYTCVPGEPVSFDLTWVGNDHYSDWQKTKRVVTLGPVTSKMDAEFYAVLAAVSGTWSHVPGAVFSGSLVDTQSKTFYRETTVKLSP